MKRHCSKRVRLALLPVAFLPAIAPAQGGVMGGNQLGPGSLLENVRTITDYYDNLSDKLGPEGPGDGKTRVAPPVDEPAGSPVARLRAMIPPALQGVLPEGNRRAGYRDGRRDPFSPSDRLLQASLGQAGSPQFQPLNQATEIPRMHLRGLIEDEGGNVAALLEIENSGIHIVREGDTVGLYEMGVNSVIRVRRINRLNLVVEAGSLGQMIIVR